MASGWSLGRQSRESGLGASQARIAMEKSRVVCRGQTTLKNPRGVWSMIPSCVFRGDVYTFLNTVVIRDDCN